MKLINCDLLEVVPDRLYGGATGSKIAVRFDGRVWMLKSCERLRNKVSKMLKFLTQMIQLLNILDHIFIKFLDFQFMPLFWEILRIKFAFYVQMMPIQKDCLNSGNSGMLFLMKD